MTDKFNKLAGSDSLVQAVKDVLAGVPTETQEKVEALDPVNPKAVKKKFDDRKDKDIDNDGDTDASDKYLHKKRKAISKNVKKNGKGDAVDTEPKLDNGKSDIQDKVTKNVKEAKDINTKEVDKIIKHDCASHVKHAAFGEGQCISGQHTIVEDPDNPGTGHVTHYDVMFKNGPRYNVRVEELEIISESSHGHSRKKKTKEADGFEVVHKKIENNTTRTCPVCTAYSMRIEDDLYMNKFECCFNCYIQYVEDREERWKTGWRPNK